MMTSYTVCHVTYKDVNIPVVMMTVKSLMTVNSCYPGHPIDTYMTILNDVKNDNQYIN